MVSKDQAIGGAILAVCVIVAVLYLVALIRYQPSWLSTIGNIAALQRRSDSGSSLYQSL